MKLTNDMCSPYLPRMLVFQPAGLIDFPSSVDVSDTCSVVGSGIGNGSNSIKTALGEYFERRHFYREVFPEKKGRLEISLTEREVKGFSKVFSQTALKEMCAKVIEGHEFSLSKVLRASDFSECYIPTVCLSLSARWLEEDVLFYPHKDTCGCSFHWDLEVAFWGAVKEFLERQFLLRFWLTRRCVSICSSYRVSSVLADSQARRLYEALVSAGEVTVLDITDYAFPGVCILLVYGQRSGKHHVNYCAGVAYASSLNEALEKSIFELWQTFRFINLFKSLNADECNVEDSYLRYFLSCNAYETYQRVVDVEVVGRENFCSLAFSLQDVLGILNKNKIKGYFYVRSSVMGSQRCFYCRFVSPDFFMHMNNAFHFNSSNRYARTFSDLIMPSRMNKMVPFP